MVAAVAILLVTGKNLERRQRDLEPEAVKKQCTQMGLREKGALLCMTLARAMFP